MKRTVFKAIHSTAVRFNKCHRNSSGVGNHGITTESPPGRSLNKRTMFARSFHDPFWGVEVEEKGGFNTEPIVYERVVLSLVEWEKRESLN